VRVANRLALNWFYPVPKAGGGKLGWRKIPRMLKEKLSSLQVLKWHFFFFLSEKQIFEKNSLNSSDVFICVR